MIIYLFFLLLSLQKVREDLDRANDAFIYSFANYKLACEYHQNATKLWNDTQ
jgi:hypothetical protein